MPTARVPRVARTLALASLLLLLTSLTTDAQGISNDTITCTRAELNAFDAARFSLSGATSTAACSLQLRLGACDDACLEGFETLLLRAPNCSDLTNENLNDRTSDTLATCEEYRAAADDPDDDSSYTPPVVVSGALPLCTFAQKTTWDDAFGSGSTFAACAGNITTKNGCGDGCLRAIEAGVVATPHCVDVSGYWVGEIEKRWLRKCLDARNDTWRENAVMLTRVVDATSVTPGGTTVAPVAKTSFATSSSSTRAVFVGGSANAVVLVATGLALLLSVAL